MDALKPEEFLKQLIATREAFWEQMNAERKSYGAEKPLSAAVVLRRLQFGVVMERKAAEVTAPWVGKIPDIDLQPNDIIYVPFSWMKNIAMSGSQIAASTSSAAIYAVP